MEIDLGLVEPLVMKEGRCTTHVTHLYSVSVVQTLSIFATNQKYSSSLDGRVHVVSFNSA